MFEIIILSSLVAPAIMGPCRVAISFIVMIASISRCVSSFAFHILLYYYLVQGKTIFQIGRGCYACKGFEIADKMRLIEIATIIRDGRQWLCLLGDEL